MEFKLLEMEELLTPRGSQYHVETVIDFADLSKHEIIAALEGNCCCFLF